MKLTLYYAPMTCALVPYVTLTEAVADFTVVDVNTRANEHKTPEFLTTVNPKHKVPVLVIDGEPLTENVAIQIWIARTFPAARLLPDGGDEIRAISLMAWFASTIHPHLTPNARPQNYCDLPGSEESVKRMANTLLFEDLAIAEARLAGREWFFEHFTAVDAYFFWCFRRAVSFGLDVSQFASCAAHLERVSARSSVQKVVAHEKEAQRAFAAAR